VLVLTALLEAVALIYGDWRWQIFIIWLAIMCMVILESGDNIDV